MPLVYLDTSTLSILADCLRKDRPRFDQFQDFWAAKSCAAAFSMAVLAEIRQHGMAVAREERYAVLDALLPVRTDLPPREDRAIHALIPGDREIIRALLRDGPPHGTRELSAHEREHLENLFPWSTETGWSTRAVRQYEDQEFNSVVNAARQAITIQAAELSRAPATPHKRLRFADLSSEPTPPEQVQRGLTEVDRIMNDPSELGRLYPRLSAPMRVNRASAERSIVEESGKVGLARAMARHAGARGQQDKNQVDRYLFRQTFRERAEEVICSLGAESVEDVRAAVDHISIEACPGWWLWQHAQIAFRNANPEPEPADFFDIEHLLYFPYVDLLFADKRTADYAALALKDDRCPPQIANRARPSSIGGKHVADIERALGSI